MRKDISKRAADEDVPVGFHHFALLRGHYENLPLPELGELYLFTRDTRVVRKALRRVREVLLATAFRAPDAIGVDPAEVRRLLDLDPASLTVTERLAVADLPSLEEFRLDYDPGGFYQEAELIEIYEEKFGQSRAVSAALDKTTLNAGLRRSLNDVLLRLETHVVRQPQPDDRIAYWVSPAVSAPLAAAEIRTLGQLVAIINDFGYSWYRHVKGFSVVRGKAVIRWLQTNQVHGLHLAPTALAPYHAIKEVLAQAREASFGLVPLEYLLIPAELDGSTGWNRLPAPAGSNKPKHDLEAIHYWLDLTHSANARRSYRQHIERFLLWMLIEKGRALSAADERDCIEYVNFLAAFEEPGTPWPWRTPRAEWVCTLGKRIRRTDPRWRPFGATTLERNSANHAIVSVRAAFSKWTTMKYLSDNPWLTVKPPARRGYRIMVNRRLNDVQWQAVTDTLTSMEDVEKRLRMAVILGLGYAGALRLHEIAQLRVRNLSRGPDRVWRLMVHGKGDVYREIPVADELFAAITAYMEFRHHGTDAFGWNKSAPLVAALSTRPDLERAQASGAIVPRTKKKIALAADEPLSNRGLAEAVKVHFRASAHRLRHVDAIDASELWRASTHWLRHTSANDMIREGVTLPTAQALLGHKNVATTSIYLEADDSQKLAAVRGLSKRLATPAAAGLPAPPATPPILPPPYRPAAAVQLPLIAGSSMFGTTTAPPAPPMDERGDLP